MILDSIKYKITNFNYNLILYRDNQEILYLFIKVYILSTYYCLLKIYFFSKKYDGDFTFGDLLL